MIDRTPAESRMDRLNQELRELLAVSKPNQLVLRRITRIQTNELPAARRAVQKVRGR